MLYEKLSRRIEEFQRRYEKVSRKDIMKVIMLNDAMDIETLLDRLGF